MRESEWTRKLCAKLTKFNALVLSFVGQKMQEPGIPDRYITHTKFQGWVEFKGEKTKLTGKQKWMIENLKKRGAKACVVRYPNRIEDENGELLATFDNCLQLLDRLHEL